MLSGRIVRNIIFRLFSRKDGKGTDIAALEHAPHDHRLLKARMLPPAGRQKGMQHKAVRPDVFTRRTYDKGMMLPGFQTGVQLMVVHQEGEEDAPVQKGPEKSSCRCLLLSGQTGG